MALTRYFIDWKASAIPSAVEYLCQRYRRGSTVDMDGVIVVVPGSRAGRRLLDQLLERTRAESWTVLPPSVETVSVFPEQLYTPKRPFASDLTQLLAWRRALGDVTPETLSRIVARPPEASDFRGWMDLARMIWRLHRELAADSLNFQDVAEKGQQLPGFQEERRWRALRDIQMGYLKTLDDLGLWDPQTARLYAIDFHECHTDRDVILVGTVDLNQAVREMLDQISERVTALVFAPPSFEDHFDSHGCVVPVAWRDAEIPVPLEQIRVAAGPAEQAEAVVDVLHSYGGRYRTDEVVVGMPDDALLPALERKLTEFGVATRWVVGQKLSESAPVTLLSSVGRYLNGRRFRDFGSLVRHPDVYDWLYARVADRDWLQELDDYRQAHLQNELGDWLGRPDEFPLLPKIHQYLEEALQPLATDAVRPVNAWADRITMVLSTIYGARHVDRSTEEGNYFQQALQQVRGGLLEMQSVPPELASEIDSRTAIDVLVEQLASGQITARSRPGAVDLLGWLELPLDLAPALVITSFNEGLIPSSLNADLFLPNALRQHLGLADNLRRYARDAYALSLILASRSDVTMIVGRRDMQDNPLTPSRLLFTCRDESLTHRVLQLFAEPPVRPRTLDAPEPTQRAFVVPRPAPLEKPIEAVSVTAFRTYLECPYRFYLKHVLNLETSSDQIEELDAAAFGSLIHQVLERFGKHAIHQSTDADEISEFLRHELARAARIQFGDNRMPAVEVQILQLETRLNAFAQWQAGWAAQGWTIRQTEIGQFQTTPQIVVDGRALRLKGRIDRLDFHPQTGEWIVFDYKTSEQARSPNRVHRRMSEWIDLQLPLYRVLVRSLGITQPVRLGYILLPRDTSEIGASLADWTEEDLAEADEVAVEVARGILDEVFWPPRALGANSDFAAICQEGVLGRQLEGEPS